jgi:quinol-cytochrome oxidoreductase complex cytochrome b subunit
MAEAAPIIGAKLKLLLLGGHTINGAALLRFYVLHCVILPLWAILGLSVHIWRVRKDGGIYLPPPKDGQRS